MLLSFHLSLRLCRPSPSISAINSHFFSSQLQVPYWKVPVLDIMPPKRKRGSVAVAADPTLPPGLESGRSAPKRQATRLPEVDTNPDHNAEILDGKTALRASPDADGVREAFQVPITQGTLAPPVKTNDTYECTRRNNSDSSLSELSDTIPVATPAKKLKKSPTKSSIAAKKGSDEIKAFRAQQAAKKVGETNGKKVLGGDEWDKRQDPDGDDTGPVEDVDTLKLEAARPPPVNSNYLPLPWKGRLGYVSTILYSSCRQGSLLMVKQACLNTYLRSSNPPVFSSRTCRIASILEHRHPLKDSSLPEHPIKNRPDKSQPASVERGQRYVEELGIANARDIVKMLRWNDKYGIKFMRLSSEMFPFASHLEYGYQLAPFASEVLAEAGRVAAELGHRLSTHPGQVRTLSNTVHKLTISSSHNLVLHAQR
jgi:UV DNA damage endonuclease